MMNRTPPANTPLKVKQQLDAADNILRYLASYINKEIDEQVIIDITNALSDYSDQYWPEGPKVEKIS